MIDVPQSLPNEQRVAATWVFAYRKLGPEEIRAGKGRAIMFGKPQWFVPKVFGWGLTPITWQGWVYAGVWAAVIALPFIVLLCWRGWFEASVWMALMIGWLCFDVYQILRAMKEPPEPNDLLMIMEDQEVRRDTLKTDKLQFNVTQKPHT